MIVCVWLNDLNFWMFSEIVHCDDLFFSEISSETIWNILYKVFEKQNNHLRIYLFEIDEKEKLKKYNLFNNWTRIWLSFLPFLFHFNWSLKSQKLFHETLSNWRQKMKKNHHHILFLFHEVERLMINFIFSVIYFLLNDPISNGMLNG